MAAIAISLPGAPAEEKKLFPLRRRTGTAAFHMSRDAVDCGLEDLEKLTPKQAVFFMAELLWGSSSEMTCLHCGTHDTHYWSAKELRWKCKCCGKRFSVTSGTVFADRKLPIVKILKMAYTWANGAAGVAALQIRRDWHVTYKTAFMFLHKLREGLLRGFNTGALCGVTEMDGMDINGRRYKEKRNRPLGGGSAGTAKIPEYLLKPRVDAETGEIFGPPKPPKFDKKAKQPEDRRLLLVMCQRGVANGKGAVATRVAVARTESAATVTAAARRFVSAESSMMSDEDSAYFAFGKLFAEHHSINHSKGYSDGNGVSNNLAESFNQRMRRLAEGVYLSLSNKYLTSYAAEAAWRQDTRRLSTGKKLKQLLHSVMGVGLSQWFCGYVQGKHREVELLVEGERPAKGRGRRKGWKSMPPR